MGNLPRWIPRSIIGLTFFIGNVSLVLFSVFLFIGPLRLTHFAWSESAALGWDAFISSLFFVQHSGMVRKTVRGRMSSAIPPGYQDALYTIVSGLLLIVVVVFWQASAAAVYELHGPFRWMARAMFFLAICGFAWGVLSLRSFDAFGIKAIMARDSGRQARPQEFAVRGPYLWVRHPLYLFVILLIWTCPDVTVDRLLFNILWTAWICLGAVLEERDLLASFGRAYREYQQKVPMLIPFLVRSHDLRDPGCQNSAERVRTKGTAAASGCVTGIAVFLVVFLFWMGFSREFITFYRDDNVVATVPMLVDAARQAKSGHFPWTTPYVGGPGGTPLVTIMQPGVLSPLKLIPAMVLEHDPQMLMDFLASLHLALFALGGWFLAVRLGSPPWAGLVAAFSLGFCGSFGIGAGNWDHIYLPYTFLPWIMGGIIWLSQADSLKQVALAHVVTAWAGLSLFFSGSPTAAFYGFPVVLCSVVVCICREPASGRRLFRRLFVQAMLLLIAAGPLLWSAKKLYDFHDRATPAIFWKQLSVPLSAYVGLLWPSTSSEWLQVGISSTFSNVPLACGFVPVWVILVGLAIRPSLFRRLDVLCLVAASLIFVPVLSPDAFGLAEFFAQTPLIRGFRWPFRALPAFQVLIVFLFLVLAETLRLPAAAHREVDNGSQPRAKTWAENRPARLPGTALVGMCLALSWFAIGAEVRRATPGSPLISWFVTNRYYEDQETWSETTLDRLRAPGYLVNLHAVTPYSAWFQKPRLCFTGNLGAQYRVPTLHRYLLATSPAYRDLGMQFSGVTGNWPAIKFFIKSSLQQPGKEDTSWDNGIAPADLAELVRKTYVRAAVVDNAMKQPMDYFLTSPAWEMLEARETVTTFVRKNRSCSWEAPRVTDTGSKEE
jgi:methanethiol S-methyltransferase